MTQLINLFFDLPLNLQRLIYEYDSTYHNIWGNIFTLDKDLYYYDVCIHGMSSLECPSNQCKQLYEKLRLEEEEYLLDSWCEKEKAMRKDIAWEQRWKT